MSDEDQIQTKISKFASPSRNYVPVRHLKIVSQRKVNKSVAHSEFDGRFSSNDEMAEDNNNRMSEGGGPPSKNEYYIALKTRPQSNRIENTARPLIVNSKKLPIEFNSLFATKTEPKSKYNIIYIYTCLYNL